jgi:hypothetical protein
LRERTRHISRMGEDSMGEEEKKRRKDKRGSGKRER